MSSYTRKVRKRKLLRLRAKSASESFEQLLSACAPVLRWTTKQTLLYVQLVRRLPRMNDRTLNWLLQSIQIDPNPFSPEDVSERILDLVSNERFVHTIEPDWRLGSAEPSPIINEPLIVFAYKWWSPKRLMAFTEFCRMSREPQYIPAMMNLMRWIEAEPLSFHLKFNDVNDVMDTLRVQEVMDS